MDITKYIKFYFEFYDYLKNRFSDETPLSPLHIYIEPTNICTLDCPFCASSIMERSRQNLDINLYKKVIDNIVDLHWNDYVRVTLTGQGEPVLNKELTNMIRYAKDKGIINIELITNATILTESISEGLIEAGLDRIQFSIDSINQETYDKLRRAKKKNKSYYYDTMKNTIDFLSVNVKNGFPVYSSISAVLTSANRDEKDDFIEFWNKLPVDNIFFIPLSTLQNNSPLKEIQRFNGDIKAKPVCIIPWISMSVKSNGDITICSHDYHNRYPAGNIKKNSLQEAWNNKKARRLRKSLITAELQYFKKIGHDCIKCNNPLIGCGKDDYMHDLPIYMEKTVLGKFQRGNRYGIKNKNRLKKLKAYFENNSSLTRSKT